MAAAKKRSGKRDAPWDRGNPKAAKGESHHLTASQKASAQRSAKKAGRHYPNLVDNMRASRGRK